MGLYIKAWFLCLDAMFRFEENLKGFLKALNFNSSFSLFSLMNKIQRIQLKKIQTDSKNKE